MAINDTENPEEGTPRNKKDVRRERRQMRAINAQRAEVGADPLYKRKEIREVGKPFKSQPSEAMTGTKDGTTYNDPNKPVETTYSYQRSGLANKLDKKQREEIGPVNVTKEQYEAIIEGGEAGQALVKTLTQPNTASTTTEVIQNKATTDPNLTSNQVDTLNKTGIEAGNQVSKTNQDLTKEELEAKNALSNIGEVTKVEPGTAENWVNTVVTEGFTPESAEDIYARAANAARKKAPQLVVEKLGVQDYYPEIGRDIAVGTFTGSRIGSQTIYSGAGGVLPLGLYDARKRAIAAEAKRKEALMDQLKEMPDIAKQYKPAFAQDFYQGLQPYLDAYKDNPDALASDAGFLKYMANKKAVGENFSKVSSYLSDLENKLVDPKTGEPAAWVTPGMLKIINGVKNGMLPGKVEDYFSGQKNIANVLNTVRALPDALNQADDIVKILIEKGGVETAVNLKTGKDFTKEDIAELNSLVKNINSPSPDYEMFAELRRKFFDFKYDQIAKDWVNMHYQDQPQSVKDEVIKNMSNYIESQMPKEAFIATITKQTNDLAERQNAQLDYQASMARIQADKEMFYADYNRHSSLTRGLYEGMKRLGNDSESFAITGGEPTDKDGLKMEWEVWDNKTNSYRYVKGSDIMNSKDQFYASQADAINPFGKSFIPESTVYVVPTENNMINQGGNYNLSTYGNAYKSMRKLEDGSNEVSVPISTKVRTPYQTAFDKNGNFNDGVIGSADAVIGSKYERIAGKIYSGGGTEKVRSSSYQYNREPVNPQNR
jgi:hypothetical protein